MRSLVIGCGNLLRGDDAVGPLVVRRLRERGLSDDVDCVDAGTSGIDVLLRLGDVGHLVVVDACRSGAPAGTLCERHGDQLGTLPPPDAINLHALRWDQALAFARWRLAGRFPSRVTAVLVEGSRFEPGEPLTPAVARGVDEACERVLALLSPEPA